MRRPSGMSANMCGSDLEKSLLEAIQLTLDDWSHIQQVDYEQLPFKCKVCHEYSHFAKSFPKSQVTKQQSGEKYQWQTQKKKCGSGKPRSHPPQGSPLVQPNHGPSSIPPITSRGGGASV